MRIATDIATDRGPVPHLVLERLGKALKLPGRIIFGDDGSPYLTRIYLTPDADYWRTRLPGVFLHRFHRGDHDRELHNHPRAWRWALSLILLGGYDEERKDGRYAPIEQRTYRPGSLNVLHHDTFHRVDLHDPERGCWTLFVVSSDPDRKPGDVSDWGFLSRDGEHYENWVDRDVRIRKEHATEDEARIEAAEKLVAKDPTLDPMLG